MLGEEVARSIHVLLPVLPIEIRHGLASCFLRKVKPNFLSRIPPLWSHMVSCVVCPLPQKVVQVLMQFLVRLFRHSRRWLPRTAPHELWIGMVVDHSGEPLNARGNVGNAAGHRRSGYHHHGHAKCRAKLVSGAYVFTFCRTIPLSLAAQRIFATPSPQRRSGCFSSPDANSRSVRAKPISGTTSPGRR